MATHLKSMTLFSLFFTVLPARAEIDVFDSLEWMAVDATVIMLGKVLAYEDSKDPGFDQEALVLVEETIKGKPVDRSIRVRLRQANGDRLKEESKGGARSFLFFLRQMSASREPYWTFLDLDKPEEVFLGEMRHPKGAEEILRVVREYSVRKPPPGVGGAFDPQRGFLRLEVPPLLYPPNGSIAYLLVPAEEKYRPITSALILSRNYQKRSDGADMLRNFPGEETVKQLSALLDDPAEELRVNGQGEVSEISYPVRISAYDALLSLGAKVKEPVLKRKPLESERSHQKKRRPAKCF